MKRRPGRLVTIGSFDGVHLGHAALLTRTVAEAKRRHLKSLALTFSMPPRMVLNKANPVSILSTPSEKEYLIQSLGVDEVRSLSFNSQFSKIKPYAFFRSILMKEFKAKGVVVGLDFRFGMNRAAGAIELVRWGQEQRIPVWVIPQVKLRSKVVSSTEIRSHLMESRYGTAMRLLGHPYLVEGTIVKGRGQGKKIGFPTTNIEPVSGKVLPGGVFVVRGRLKADRGGPVFYGVCNIGRRPTFLKKSSVLIEPHWFGQRIPQTGQTVLLELLRYLRAERKFNSEADLKSAIKRDVVRAKNFLKKVYKTG